MSTYTVSRLALDAGVSVHIVRDYLLQRIAAAGGVHPRRLRPVR